MHSPPWLRDPVVRHSDGSVFENPPIEIEVDLDDLTSFLATHHHVQPKHKRWTLSRLRAKEKSLIKQIERARARHAEEAILKERCLALAMELEEIRSGHTTKGFPKAP